MAVLSKIARALEVPGEQSLYINDDIKPLPLARRTWSKRTFTLFWLATSAAPFLLLACCRSPRGRAC